MLAERERRMNDGSSRDSSGDFSDLNKQNTALVTQHLVEEIRQAVNEANARGNFLRCLRLNNDIINSIIPIG